MAFVDTIRIAVEYRIRSHICGIEGLKQYIYLNGNQAAPNPDPDLPFADRRPLPQLDGFAGWFRSAGHSNYNSLQ